MVSINYNDNDNHEKVTIIKNNGRSIFQTSKGFIVSRLQLYIGEFIYYLLYYSFTIIYYYNNIYIIYLFIICYYIIYYIYLRFCLLCINKKVMITISSSHMEGFCFKSIYANEKTVGI